MRNDRCQRAPRQAIIRGDGEVFEQLSQLPLANYEMDRRYDEDLGTCCTILGLERKDRTTV